MSPNRPSTVQFYYAGFDPETVEDEIAALRGDWGFELCGTVFVNDLMPHHLFRLWVCARHSIARDVTLTAWERLRANRQHFLASVLLMDEETSTTSVERAVTDVIRECEAASQGGWEQFYNLMLRFVDWDEDTFNWGYAAIEPEITRSMQLRIPQTSAAAQVFPGIGSIEIETGTRTGFTVLACTNSWVGSVRDSLDDRLLSPKVFGSDHLFPVGLVVVNEGSDWTEVEPALRQVLEECESRAEGDSAYFRTLASRFIVWDGDPFAFPWSA